MNSANSVLTVIHFSVPIHAENMILWLLYAFFSTVKSMTAKTSIMVSFFQDLQSLALNPQSIFSRSVI
ncbi:MAG: hypothetical protein ACI9T8_000441 [Candidatus Saccharimonadales bacterium]|jgi:hypothetical protein